MSQNGYPVGWDQDRAEQVRAHYEEQTEDEAVAEDESAFEDRTQAVMGIPLALIPVVRELLAKYDSDSKVAV